MNDTISKAQHQPAPATRIGAVMEIASSYDGILCDVWGVIHNGESVYHEAVGALVDWRKSGRNVVLITNSPRPKAGVEEQLIDMGVDPACYDEIVTSGDVTRVLIAQVEGPVFLLGPERDLPLFEGLNATLTQADDANLSAIVCTGLFSDETESPEDYRDMLQGFVDRGIPLICANPDIVVERGDRLIWCAGALARLYSELGGSIGIAGKPHKPIYDLAFKRLLEAANAPLPKTRVLAIGDGMPTDVAGAGDNGFDLLYISGGIHNGEYGGAEDPDPVRLQAFFEQQNAKARFWIPRLV